MISDIRITHRKIFFYMLLPAIAFFSFSIKDERKSAGEEIRQWIIGEVSSLENNLDSVALATSTKDQIFFYHEARRHYKHIEFFIEYYSRSDARYYFNGPLVPKYEPDLGDTMLPPHGFQRIEQIIYESTSSESLSEEVTILKDRLASAKIYYSEILINEANLVKLCQLELYRISSFGLNGYDATISQTALQECVWSIEGMETLLTFYQGYVWDNNPAKAVYDHLLKQLSHAKLALLQNPDYDTFNRLDFIVDNINPLNKAFNQFHSFLGKEWNDGLLVLQLKNDNLFGEESLNKQRYQLNYADTFNLEKQIALGEKLFYDSILSGNNKISCASCHRPDKAFTGGAQFNTGVNNTILQRNTPSLLNVIYQYSFFYDGRVNQLDEQAQAVILNPDEMHGNFDSSISRISSDSRYVKAFYDAFKNYNDSIICATTIKKALVEFEKTLISLNSRFDQYLRGNRTLLSKREVNGYNLFAGKALCGSCHFLPLFNGTVPPYFTENEFEVIGVPATKNNQVLDADAGRGIISRLPEQMHAFKTPTVRNIAVTAPYMHNGVYNTLEEVLDFYHKGGGAGFGYDVPNQTLPFDSLQLSKKEKEDIVLFMKTLTDTVSYKKHPY